MQQEPPLGYIPNAGTWQPLPSCSEVASPGTHLRFSTHSNFLGLGASLFSTVFWKVFYLFFQLWQFLNPLHTMCLNKRVLMKLRAPEGLGQLPLLGLGPHVSAHTLCHPGVQSTGHKLETSPYWSPVDALALQVPDHRDGSGR
jgi:hypothetical protein